jgi:hypothetical protein
MSLFRTPSVCQLINKLDIVLTQEVLFDARCFSAASMHLA